MANLNEKKILIAEAYLKIVAGLEPRTKGRSARVEAIKEIDPLIKNPSVYAYKLWKDSEFQNYLMVRRSEILMESSIDIVKLVKGTSERLEESIGIKSRKLTNFSKDKGFIYSEEGMHPDSKDAKNYFEILEKVLGNEISFKANQEVVDSNRELEIKEAELAAKKKLGKEKFDHKVWLDKENLEIKRNKKKPGDKEPGDDAEYID